ncbi:MAG: hypothetical protein EHM28_07405 [Spirochaetaceae bacterium]|nr:MAG: hypothetical protein EHM28_07405 [Spirochaetaceae bacterium]
MNINIAIIIFVLLCTLSSCDNIDEEKIITEKYLQKISEFKSEGIRFTKIECNIYASLDTSMRIVGKIPPYKKVTVTSE